MDAVERGESFTVTRDGHRIGELVPLRRKRAFVPRADFVWGSARMPTVDLDGFRADQDAFLDSRVDDPFEHARD